ncbi:MAG: tRNA preQ1(34) S-adenosylmethionine ribosyltransferase-isomerase QueA [Syntrophorhabdaceae bacterium]|nr:tRNA preQ1(34) S-adenosylmethionine ribosyltransferase-isomerase QueA [Syntrophorhabdaceae bacterium]
MNIEDFDYFLPEGFVAQYPEKDRTSSRLLVYDREKGAIEHRFFKDILDYLNKGDVLVLNDSKVLPSRLKAKKTTGGEIDITLVERIEKNRWFCLAKGIKRGISRFTIDIGDVKARLERDKEGQFWIIDFVYEGDSMDLLNRYGMMPLPPYIKRKNREELDFNMYQTVYAHEPGSIAAPTAGLHFTEELLDMIEQKGINIVKITLHIGVGTFFLIKKQNVEEHVMHREYYIFPEGTKEAIKKARAGGKRIIACGTSSVRTLESVFFENGDAPLKGYTDIFIYPGFRFKVVDGLITNFHLPRSTPLMLVAAFTGRDEILRCYNEAIEKGYRFYSYGDAMLII